MSKDILVEVAFDAMNEYGQLHDMQWPGVNRRDSTSLAAMFAGVAAMLIATGGRVTCATCCRVHDGSPDKWINGMEGPRCPQCNTERNKR